MFAPPNRSKKANQSRTQSPTASKAKPAAPAPAAAKRAAAAASQSAKPASPARVPQRVLEEMSDDDDAMPAAVDTSLQSDGPAEASGYGAPSPDYGSPGYRTLQPPKVGEPRFSLCLTLPCSVVLQTCCQGPHASRAPGSSSRQQSGSSCSSDTCGGRQED